MTKTTSCRSPLPEPCLHLSAHTALHPCDVPEAYFVHTQHSHEHHFSIEPRTVSLSLSFWFASVLPLLILWLIQRFSGCSTHDRQTWGTMETPSPYRCVNSINTPAEAILRFSMMELRRIEVSRSFVAPTRLWVARKSWYDREQRHCCHFSNAAFQLSLRRRGCLHASELGFKPCSFHHVRLTLTPRC